MMPKTDDGYEAAHEAAGPLLRDAIRRAVDADRRARAPADEVRAALAMIEAELAQTIANLKADASLTMEVHVTARMVAVLAKIDARLGEMIARENGQAAQEIDRQGEPGVGWAEHRAYGIEDARDVVRQALAELGRAS